MPQFPLTKGQFALIDEVDRPALLAIGAWSFSSSGYAVHYQSAEAGRRTTLYMHRIIMERSLGTRIPRGYQVDHVSGAADGPLARLDNRRDNLRLATRSQNQAHKGISRNNTTEYKGVSFRQGKWEARIKYGNHRLQLGRFSDPVVAAQRYDAASRLLYADFAGCNFPDLLTAQATLAQVRAVLARYGLSG